MVRDLLLGVVMQLVGVGRYQIHEDSLEYLRLISQAVLAINKQKNMETGDSIKVIKEW